MAAQFGELAAGAYAPGQAVTWAYTPRGGYGYTYPVDGVVIRSTARRVLIAVRKASGESVTRWVTPDNLRPRQASPAPEGTPDPAQPTGARGVGAGPVDVDPQAQGGTQEGTLQLGHVPPPEYWQSEAGRQALARAYEIILRRIAEQEAQGQGEASPATGAQGEGGTASNGGA